MSMKRETTRTVQIENNGATMTIVADSSISKKEIAKGIRDAIKVAVKVGILPKAKYSCRQPYHGSIDITATGLPFRILSKARVADDMGMRPATRPWMSDEASALVKLLEAIGNAWNWDLSRPEEDYYHSNYHLSVEVGSWEARDVEREQIMREIGAEEYEAMLDRREATERAEMQADMDAEMDRREANDNAEGDFQIAFF
jgi:hypothetical protein